MRKHAEHLQSNPIAKGIRTSTAKPVGGGWRSIEVMARLLALDVTATREIHAWLSPAFLRKLLLLIRLDEAGSPNLRATTQKAANPLKSMVGATGIEPVTPTMSR